MGKETISMQFPAFCFSFNYLHDQKLTYLFWYVLQVYTASRDGTLRLWDVEQETCLRQYDVHSPVFSMVVHASLHLAYLSLEHADAGRVVSLRLDSGQPAHTILKTRVPGPVVMNPRGRDCDKQTLPPGTAWCCQTDSGNDLNECPQL
jgi:WD40 repeat protein